MKTEQRSSAQALIKNRWRVSRPLGPRAAVPWTSRPETRPARSGRRCGLRLRLRPAGGTATARGDRGAPTPVYRARF